MIKKSPPPQQNIYQQQSKQTKNGESHGGVRQDKSGFASDRTASHQPASDSGGSDRGPSATKTARSKSESVPSRAKVPFTLHVDPLVKAEVMRLATLNTANKDDSASAEGAALLEAMVRQKIHIQQAATLETTLERLMATFSRRMAKKFAFFLTTILFDVGQTKVLTTNLLGMQKGMSEDMLKAILTDADKHTKRRLSRKYPELTEFTQAIEQWLLGDAGGGETNGKPGRGGAGV
jgi:hypothetical protein